MTSQYDFVNELNKKRDLNIYPTKPRKPVESTFGKEYHLYANALHKYDLDIIKYQSAMNEYRNKDNQAQSEFKISLFEYLGITDHPKAEKIYNMARSKGDSLDSIVEWAEELSELILE